MSAVLCVMGVSGDEVGLPLCRDWFIATVASERGQMQKAG